MVYLTFKENSWKDRRLGVYDKSVTCSLYVSRY